ncbi:unnamed protein product [Ixodes persulcatus]
MIEIMAQMLQHDLSTAIKTSLFFEIIADGMTDVTGNEQFTLCLHWVDRVNESSRRFYKRIQSTRHKVGNTFPYCEGHDCTFGFSFEKLRGMCFDGAANMSGRFSGVQKKIADVQPK